jgi:hypothetical protein
LEEREMERVLTKREEFEKAVGVRFTEAEFDDIERKYEFGSLGRMELPIAWLRHTSALTYKALLDRVWE